MTSDETVRAKLRVYKHRTLRDAKRELIWLPTCYASSIRRLIAEIDAANKREAVAAANSQRRQKDR